MLLSLLILLILVFEQLEQSGYHPWWTLKVQPSFQDWLLQSKIHQNSPLLFQILVQNDLCPRMRFDYFCDIMICSSDVFTNVMFWHYQSRKKNRRFVVFLVSKFVKLSDELITCYEFIQVHTTKFYKLEYKYRLVWIKYSILIRLKVYHNKIIKWFWITWHWFFTLLYDLNATKMWWNYLWSNILVFCICVLRIYFF